ncbi:TetR/AcrR family transcriptional regulator [Cereibacter sphaeroides]|uniref:TetR/AcrR family transcriptional regulator n=1 Tax=Cereibacter sphaeroides TaxID=1063 RepID=UPI000F54AF28|nr:TetR/AcrR family transcriptional regulator [Cereibacter sphaeroides]AZB61337.1 TetR/AcrR family transcriptional regulator [Cereibacter sphaeroides]
MTRKTATIKEMPKPANGGERADEVRRVIYERALALFETKGFAGTSMNEIASACGVSKPAIYHYFRNKSHLLETLYADITRNFFDAIQNIAFDTGGPEERLRRLIRYQSLYNISHRRFLTVFWRERHVIEQEDRRNLAEREREFEGWVRRILVDGCAAGIFREVEVDVATFGILGMLSAVHRWSPYVGQSPETVAETLSDMIVRGLLREPGEGAAVP